MSADEVGLAGCSMNREWLLERHGYRTPAEARELMARGSCGMIDLFNPSGSGVGPGRALNVMAVPCLMSN
jgi:hypothetical protein